MILSSINIGKIPREVLKSTCFALSFQHFPWDLANVNEWKIMFDPSIVDQNCVFNMTQVCTKFIIFLTYM